MRRGFWFVAGAGTGVYVMIRARRAAETFTPDGLRDRVAGLSVGAQLLAEEVRSGMAERETELRERLGYGLGGPRQLGSRLGSTAEELGSTTEEPDPTPDIRTEPHALEGTH